MRSWAMFVAVTRKPSAADFFRAPANTGTMAAKMIPANTMVTRSSTKLKPWATLYACRVVHSFTLLPVGSGSRRGFADHQVRACSQGAYRRDTDRHEPSA